MRGVLRFSNRHPRLKDEGDNQRAILGTFLLDLKRRLQFSVAIIEAQSLFAVG